MSKSIVKGIGIGFLSCTGIGIGIAKTISQVLVLVLVLLRANGSVLIKRKRDKKLRFFLIKSRILSKQNYSGIVLSHYYALVIFWKGCETQLPVIRRSLYTIITLSSVHSVIFEVLCLCTEKFLQKEKQQIVIVSYSVHRRLKPEGDFRGLLCSVTP